MTVSFLTHEHAQRKDNRKSVLHKDIMKYELHKKTIYLEVSISFLVHKKLSFFFNKGLDYSLPKWYTIHMKTIG